MESFEQNHGKLGKVEVTVTGINIIMLTGMKIRRINNIESMEVEIGKNPVSNLVFSGA